MMTPSQAKRAFDEIERAAVRWTAADVVAQMLPKLGAGAGVTGFVQCPHCGFELHAYQEVVPYEKALCNFWTAYQCVRCGATHLLGDLHGAL
jgi:hypothetical protein